MITYLFYFCQMKSETATTLLFIQNLLLNEIFSLSLANRTHTLPDIFATAGSIKQSVKFYTKQNNSLQENYENTEVERSNHVNIKEESFENYKLQSSENQRSEENNFFLSYITKRNLLFSRNQEIPSLHESQPENEYKAHSNHSTSSFNNCHNASAVELSLKNTKWPVIQHNMSSVFKNDIRPEIIFNNGTVNNSLESNTLDIYTTGFQRSGAIIFLKNQSSNDWYSSSDLVIDIQSLLQAAIKPDKNKKNDTLLISLNDTEYTMLDTLTEIFDCVIDESLSLNISCVNVDLYSIGKYLPNNTAILDLSYSTQVKLLNPLFPHLKSLNSLTLSHNHHRFITKAFMGLENLEILDLRNNDIGALLNAFLYVPRLRSLNLSDNQIIRIRSVSKAISSLKNLENLTLDNNVNIKYIGKEDLYNFTKCNISLFSLFNTTLQYVERYSFNSMPNLKFLELSVNYLNEQALANITCGLAENVETLYFGQMLQIKEFPIDALQCLTKVKVKRLNLWYNYFNKIPVLPKLPYLETLSLSNCSITEIDLNAFKNLINMKVIFLRGNKLSYVPEAISSLYNLKILYLESQRSDTGSRFLCPNNVFQNLSSLENLGISRLDIRTLSRYCLNGLKLLDTLLLSQASLFKIEDYAFETLKSLKLLDLRGNGIELLTNFTFYGLNELKYLYLAGNYITSFENIYPFQFNPLLSAILLHYNEINFIPEGLFLKQKELNMLILGNNKLVPWTKRILHPKAKLKLLGLSQNNLDYISEIMLEEFHQVTEYLDLGRNPFNCSKCGMKEFQNFCLESNLSLNLPTREAEYNFYSCMNPQVLYNENFFEVELPEVVCLDPNTRVFNMMAIISVCTFMMLAISGILICYIFRWYIRYLIFHTKTSLIHKSSILKENNYTFDAFIMYSSCDTLWVLDHLIPALEDQEPHYKLCVHERNFIAGDRITENILEAIENSRNALLILTEGFIKSEWCMYELHLAQHKLSRDTRDTLILIKLKTIDKKLYSKNLLYIEKTRRCYMWTENHIGQKLFWDQIRNQLGQPSTQQNLQMVTKC